jgi:ATP-dependent exoDNAse (exonuclease V) beta subunit
VAEGERKLTAGAIDLLYAETGGWRVVDYKTDVAPAPEKHVGQLATYERALTACGLVVAGSSVEPVRAANERTP